jgi:L-ascorbate metabolism protein UlaG (beta-lactamase superfamily)
MVITYYGGECFKIVSGPITLALNPPSKNSKLKSPRFGANITFVSLNHEDMNGTEQTMFGDRQPFVVQGPGEYEVNGIIVKGFLSASAYGGEERINTIYTIRLEDINLCFLGALNTRKLGGDIIESLGNIDILFLPIGGEGVLSASDAHELAVELEPALEIPMHYSTSVGGVIGEKDALTRFLKEESSEGIKPIDKLTLKRKDLEGKEGEVIVLGG